jgi:hypothetical protein
MAAPDDRSGDANLGSGPEGQNAALNPAGDHSGQAKSFRSLLRDLHTPQYGWFHGLDAALSSLGGITGEAAAPPAFTVRQVMNPAQWRRSQDAWTDEIREMYLYTDQVGPWLGTILDPKDVKGGYPAAVITRPLTMCTGQKAGDVDVPRSHAATAFVRTVAARAGALNIYLPINATDANGRSGHYILAVARFRPDGSAAMRGRSYTLTFDFYDSLMSGRCKVFTLDDQAEWSTAMAAHLSQWVGGQAAVAYRSPNEPAHLRNHNLREAYHQVCSQMPLTPHCGRYATLYIFADLMNIPYAEWYQERFNRVLPAFRATFPPSNPQ